MQRYPPQSPPSSGYSRSNSPPYQPPLPGHHPASQYSHPSPGGRSFSHYNSASPVDHDHHRRPPPTDQYYYSQPHQPFHLSYQSAAEYRAQLLLRPPPHPPAPPVPPPSARKFYPPHKVPTSQRSTLVPTFNYYRTHVEYDTQHGSETNGARTRERSGSTGSRSGSGLHEGEIEATPSPIDPARIQQWEEENAHGLSQCQSSRSDSDHNRDEDETIRQPLDSHREYHPPTFFGQGGHVDPGSANLDMPYSQKRANSDYYPSPHHQAQFAGLSQQTGPVNVQRGNIGLNSLVDAEPGGRPAYPIPTIIKCAILGSPHQQLTLSELYLAMEMRFNYYKNSDKKAWRNSVRHNLSLNNQFRKKERPITEPGKGHYWVVVPDMPQGNKRERKRNKKPGKRALAARAEAERLAQQQNGGSEPIGSRTDSSQTESPLETHISSTVLYPAARGYTSGTLPANAGSYAAVTGALPAPPPIDRQLFHPWEGNTSTSREESLRSTSAASRDPALRSPTAGGPERRPTQPQFGEASLQPAGLASAQQRSEEVIMRHSDSSTESSTSSSGLRSPAMLKRIRRYDPILVPIPTGPQNAFAELAAQIERDGLGAAGSGGPALTAQRKRKSRGRDMHDDEWDSDEDPSDDDEYRPRKKQMRRR